MFQVFPFTCLRIQSFQLELQNTYDGIDLADLIILSIHNSIIVLYLHYIGLLHRPHNICYTRNHKLVC